MILGARTFREQTGRPRTRKEGLLTLRLLPAMAADAGKLDDLAARAMTERRFNELAALFGKASRLEADFWQMGFDGGR